MRKTFKFKAKLSKTTAQNALVWLRLNQNLYNLALEQRILAYRQFGINLTTYDQSKELPELKKAFPEFKQVNSQVLQETVERLGKAFKGFFDRLKKHGEKAGFPRFRSLHRYDSFTLKNSGWKLDGRRKKAVKELARVHRKVKRMRLDFLHKTANHYIKNYQTICVEKLRVKNMVKNRHLSKSIVDAGWGTFFELLSYKAEEAGREVIKVSAKNTSQNCSGCGQKVPKSLATRVHTCPHCNLNIDRDINAARNIAATGSGQLPQVLT